MRLRIHASPVSFDNRRHATGAVKLEAIMGTEANRTDNEGHESNERQRTAADYDALPYPSFPYAYLQPGRLAALAMLHGLEPVPVETARVLELGCAAGGNLIPLAATYPRASFLGVDLSQRQIDGGNQRIAQLGLSNIEIRQGDLEHVSFERDSFDVILCHGVFSWVPLAVQEAILRICAESLTPAGLAVISYNVLPGWHLRSIVRDICLVHAGSEGTPIERAEKARHGLIETARALHDPGPYSTVLRREAKRIAHSPSAYILGEFLAETNTAFHFHEFAARATAKGLSYLCDGSFATSMPQHLMPAAARQIKALAGPDPIALQRQIDIFSGRQFRRSVLVKAAQAPRVSSVIDLARMRRLHLASNIKVLPATAGVTSGTFVDGKGRTFTLKDAAIVAAFSRLATSFPSTASFSDLLLANGEVQSTAGAETLLARALVRLMGTGRAVISTTPLMVGRADDPCPCVWPMARIEAASAQPWVTGQNHVGVPPPPAVRHLMPYLDGSRDRSWILQFVLSGIRRGDVRFDPPAGSSQVSTDPALLAAQAVDAALDFLARNALLQV